MDLEGLFTYSLANGSALGGHVQATASWGVWCTARALGTLELGAFFGYLNEPNSNHPWNLGASTTGTAHRIPFVITAGHSFRFGRGDRAAFGVHLYAGVVHWISSYDVRFPSYGVAGSSTVERTVPHLGMLLRFTYRPHPIVGLAVQLWAPFYGVGPGTVVSLFAVGAGVTFRAR